MTFWDRMRLRVLGSAFVLVSGVAVATADELMPPLTASTTGVVDDPPLGHGCTLPAAGPIRKAKLIVRDTVRHDVGPYAVSLPGYATDSTDSTHDSYRPFLIRAQPGDTLRIDLRNSLDPEAADNLLNLHTHGLVVSPRPYLPCDVPGDYIFDELAPGQSFPYRIDIPTTVTGIGGPGRQPFPSGLFWFHSHLHGSSKNHVQAGQSGIIAIDPTSSTPSDASQSDPTSTIRGKTDEKFLVLRDIQLAVPPGLTPDQPTAQGQAATWLHNDDYDTEACRPASNPGVAVKTGKGFCSHPNLTNPDGGLSDLVWLFTINGQVYPNISVAPGRTQLWRVANVSATVAYTIDLVDSDQSEQTLHLLSVDGVVTGTPDPADPARLRPSVAVKRVLMMPASRAEILVENVNASADSRVFVLRTRGLETGGINQTMPGDPSTPADRVNYVGDPWPAIDLATVTMQGQGAAGNLQALLDQTFSRSTATERLAEAVQDASPAVPANCVALPSGAFRRRITFDQDDTNFKLGSEVVSADGTTIDSPGPDQPYTIMPPRPFQHAVPPLSDRHVCAKLGTQETWELVNVTNEVHNFHIHQTKFRLSRPGDRGLPTGFLASDAIADPAHVIGDQVPDFGHSAGASDVDVWHDTLPVAPALMAADGVTVVKPGVTFVTIPFRDPTQVGAFVYHCHILEHEDGGMMATVEVYDPAHPAASRQGADASPVGRKSSHVAFCGSPPPNWTPMGTVPVREGWLRSLLGRARDHGRPDGG